jgi:hypothetical protein
MNTDGVDKQRIFVDGKDYLVDPEFANDYIDAFPDLLEDISQQIERKNKQISETIRELIDNPSFESVADEMLAILNKAYRDLTKLLTQKQKDLDDTMEATVPWNK